MDSKISVEPEVDYWEDMRVKQAAGSARLALEQRKHMRVPRKVRTYDLDCDLSSYRKLTGAIDLTKATDAEKRLYDELTVLNGVTCAQCRQPTSHINR